MSKLQELIQELCRLDASATPSPWTLEDDGHLEIPELRSFQEGCVGSTKFYVRDDAELIATLRNNLGKLIAIIEVQQEALNHIYSDKPRCAGCTCPDISLVEHYDCEAKQALAEVERLLTEVKWGVSRDLESLECEHGIVRSLRCIRCREALTFRRLDSLKDFTDRASQFERTMHLDDLKIFQNMLAEGKKIL